MPGICNFLLCSRQLGDLLTKMDRMKRLLSPSYIRNGLAVASLFTLAACQAPMPGSTPAPTTEPVVTLVDDGSSSSSSSSPQACECPVLESQACPQVVPAPMAVKDGKEKNFTIDDKLLVGRVENVLILPQEFKLKAKVDTGAKTSSLHAMNLTEFERDGKSWVRFAMLDPKSDEKIYFERPVVRKTKVKQQNTDVQHRPTVSMSIIFGPIEEQVDFTLADRTGYLYQVLIGRNFLRDRAIVDVSRTFITSSMD